MSERIVTNKDKRRSLDVWNTVPWLAAHRIGGRHEAKLQEAALDAEGAPAEDRARSVPPTGAHEPNGGGT